MDDNLSRFCHTMNHIYDDNQSLFIAKTTASILDAQTIVVVPTGTSTTKS